MGLLLPVGVTVGLGGGKGACAGLVQALPLPLLKC